ncbi:uncharacterized protein [Arachis hypogaea]|uniref:uncharacterized protein n=1 Tax=Arachis hypogaea TaxID=3818 RepID=UPI000DEC26BE|nr:uncharacterized protein LOC112733998 [Arachis hypogaea]
MTKQKKIVQIYGDWEKPYNKIPRFLQALQSCCPGIICDFSAVPYYDGHLMSTTAANLIRYLRLFCLCGDFQALQAFVSVDGTHLYGKYGGVLLMGVAQDGNSNTFPVAFAIVESHAIKAALRDDDNGWHPPGAFRAYCVKHITANFMSRFKYAEDK